MVTICDAFVGTNNMFAASRRMGDSTVINDVRTGRNVPCPSIAKCLAEAPNQETSHKRLSFEDCLALHSQTQSFTAASTLSKLCLTIISTIS